MTLEYSTISYRPRKMPRGSLSILESILQIISEGGMEGTIATKVANISGVTYVETIKKCQKLVDVGFLESWREGRLLLFRTTQKGLEFLSGVQQILDVARSINLRC